MNGDAAEEHLASLLVARDEALAAGRDTPQAEVPPELQIRLGQALAALQLLHEARPRGQPTAPTGEQAAGPHPEGPSTGPELPADDAAAPPGQIGRFRILRELGRGGFGVVFLAHDPHLGREVALKVPRLDALLTADLRARFQQEARAAAGLDHPNIVAVHEAGEAGPVCYIASAYCPGPTLAAWLRAQTAPVPLAEAAGLVATLAEAVQHAHSRGVLHRDLKPANVLLAGAVPKITDFGLAKLTELAADSAAPEVRTRSGAVLGTAAYMAPEQARGNQKAVGPAVDVYALGAILYECVTGRLPFAGDSDLEILLQVQNEEPLAPSRLRPRLPRDLETICLKCLEKEPGRRYASAGELADDLRRFQRGEPIRARPVGVAARAWRWCRRRPAVASLLAALALILVSGLTAVTLLWRLAEERATQLAHERDEAEKTARAAVDAVEGLFSQVGADGLHLVAGLQGWRESLLEGALKYHLEFLERGAADPRLQEQVARAYHRVGMIYSALDRRDEGLAALEKALARAHDLVRTRPEDLSHPRLLGDCQYILGLAHQQAGRIRKALPLVEQARDTYEPLAAAGAERDRASLAQTCVALGGLQSDLAREADALHSFERARQILEPLVRDHPSEMQYQRKLAATLERMALYYRGQRSPARALAALRQALPIREKLAADQLARTRRELAEVLVSLARVEIDARRLESAASYLEKALPISQQLADRHPRDFLIQIQFAECLLYLGGTYLDASWPRDRGGSEARSAPEERWPRDRGGSEARSARMDQGRRDRAGDYLRRSRAILERLSQDCPPLLEARSFLNATVARLARALTAIREPDEALRLIGEAIRRQRQVVREGPEIGRFRETLLGCYHVRALAQAARGRPGDVAATLEDIRALVPDRPDQVYDSGYWLAAAVSICALRNKDPTPQVQAEIQKYADQAMSLLRQAVARGFKDVDRLEKETAWTALRGRADFQELLRDIRYQDALQPGVRARAEAKKNLLTTWHTQRARACEKDRDWATAVSHLGQLIKAQPEEWSHHARRGRARTGLGQWAEASADFARALALAPDARELWPDHAAVLLLRGDQAGYRRFCAELLERFQPTPDARTAYLLARVWSMAPQTAAESARPLRLAEQGASARLAWDLHALGLVHYRSGRFEEAVREFHASIKSVPDWSAQACNWLGLALAHHRLGQVEEARRWWQQAVDWLDREAPKRPRDGPGLFVMHPHDWLACLLLRREAGALFPEAGR